MKYNESKLLLAIMVRPDAYRVYGCEVPPRRSETLLPILVIANQVPSAARCIPEMPVDTRGCPCEVTSFRMIALVLLYQRVGCTQWQR